MKKHLSKKRVVLAAIVTVALAIASGVAYAYWTSTSNGQGTVAVAADAPALAVSVNLTGGPLVPGGTASVSGTVSNPVANTTDVHVQQIAGATTLVTTTNAYDAITNSTGCKASDFVLTTAPAVTAQILNPGDSATFSGGVLTMNNTADNQDGCKGVTVTLHLVAS